MLPAQGVGAGNTAPPVTGTAGAGATTGAAGATTTGAAGATPGAAGRQSAGGAGAPAAAGGAGAPSMTTGGMTATTGGSSGGIAGGPMTGGTTAGGMGGMGGTPPTGMGESGCLDGITNYDTAGPFKFEMKTQGRVKMWAPMVPAGCKVPMVHLNNGTTANCGNYMNVLERFASHGFLTLCYEDPNTGAGTMGVMAFEAAMMAYPDLYAKKIGSTGHSQGGQAAFATLALSEAKWGMEEFIYAGLAMEPASGFGTQPSGGWQPLYAKIKSPMFAFSGTADMLVPQAWVQQGYDALNDSIEAYHWSAVGATHIPTPQPETMQVGVAWWRWKLLGDQKACEWFKKLPDGNKWNVVKEQNVKPCM